MTTDPTVLGKDSGVANTNVIWHAGRLLALEEGHQPFEVDPTTLSPRGYVDYAGRAGRFTAHPKFDPETGEMVFFGYGVTERDGWIDRAKPGVDHRDGHSSG